MDAGVPMREPRGLESGRRRHRAAPAAASIFPVPAYLRFLGLPSSAAAYE